MEQLKITEFEKDIKHQICSEGMQISPFSTSRDSQCREMLSELILVEDLRQKVSLNHIVLESETQHATKEKNSMQ